jgi:hypothetical protein
MKMPSQVGQPDVPDIGRQRRPGSQFTKPPFKFSVTDPYLLFYASNASVPFYASNASVPCFAEYLR